MAKNRRKIKELEVMVAETIDEAHDTVTLLLFTGNDTLDYQAGHFLTISPHQFEALERWVDYLEDLKGKKEPPRAYSLSSSPDEKYIAITVKEERYIKGSTPYPPLLSPILAKRTSIGTKMIVTGFTGPFTLKEEDRLSHDHAVHICAGSGVVPCYSIIKHDLRMNERLKHTLLFSNKHREDIIFHREFDDLKREFPDRFDVVHTLTREESPKAFQNGIRKGRITEELIREFVDAPEEALFFVCGPDHDIWSKRAARESDEELPPSFMSSMLGYLKDLGVTKDKITKESWG